MNPDTNIKQKEFLEKLDVATANLGGAERALWVLLDSEKDNIFIPDNDPSWLHKSFRQTDVTKSGKLDWAIWLLMGWSTIIWEVMDEVYPE